MLVKRKLFTKSSSRDKLTVSIYKVLGKESICALSSRWLVPVVVVTPKADGRLWR